MNKRLIEHLFGISNGIYVAVAMLMLLAAFSYANKKRFKGLGNIYLLLFSIITGFWCYSIFWQHFHSPDFMPYYPSWLYKPTLFITLLTCAISTYTYIRFFGYKWIKRYKINSYVQFFEYFSYAFYCVSAIYLCFDVDIYIANFVLLFNFLWFCTFALVFTLVCSNNWIGKIYAGLFSLIIVYFLILGYFSYTKELLAQSFVMSLSQLFVSFFVLTFCFVSLRYGYKELTAFFHLHTIDQYDIVSDFPKALSEDEFFIEYQPQIDLHTGKIIGAEALIRWQHASKGRIQPNDFIPLAESINIIDNVTQWLIKKAVAQAKLLFANDTPIAIAINFSPLNFNLNMVSFLENELKKASLPPKYIIVEMTENLLLQESDEVKASLNKLDDMGIAISIDDYGTGYSSLSYLKKMAIDELKIDRSFIYDIRNNKDNYEIVRSTLDMAKNLSLHVVAEGVEDEATREILKKLGCKTAQGFGLIKPVEPNTLIILMTKQKFN